MWEEFENALSWYAAAPTRWVQSAKQDMAAAAEWIWVVLQGDFADDQSTAQVVTGTVVSMIPLVDQLCDIRDVVANCRKINQDTSNKLAWLALALTLIGLFPCLGSLAKGCLKIPFNYGRKYALKGAAKTLDSSLWKNTAPFVESSIVKLNQHLAYPAVRKTLAVLKIDNAWKYLARKVREVKGLVSTTRLMSVFDDIAEALASLCELIQKWGNAALQSKAAELLRSVKTVRDQANKTLSEVVKPLQDWLDKLARRLEVEADMNYRAYTNALTPHRFARPTLEAEIAAIKADLPSWVKVSTKAPKEALEDAPLVPHGYPDISKTNPNRVLRGKFDTFHSIEPREFPPGTTLYRVLDPNSADNSICWMSKEEFELLKSKDDWRERFAVWMNWNRNGEYVTYTVPPGKPLRTWEGEAASQELKDSAGRAVKDASGKSIWAVGGGKQIVLDPADLDKAYLGKRQPTGWGYGDAGEKIDLVGVPTLTNYWFESK